MDKAEAGANLAKAMFGVTLTSVPMKAEAVRELVEALNIMADLEEAGLTEYHRTVLRSSAAALAASSDEEDWEATLRYCEKQWQDERRTMIEQRAAAHTKGMLDAAEIAEAEYQDALTHPWRHGPVVASRIATAIRQAAGGEG